MRPLLARVPLVTSLVLVVAGCSAADPADTAQPLASYQGRTLAVAASSIPDDVYLRVIDMSIEFGAEPTYETSMFGDPAWIVLSLCADAPTLEEATTVELGVAPESLTNDEVLEQAHDGAYASDLVCLDLTHRPTNTHPVPSPLPAVTQHRQSRLGDIVEGTGSDGLRLTL